jgi:hypothetical protein
MGGTPVRPFDATGAFGRLVLSSIPLGKIHQGHNLKWFLPGFSRHEAARL